MAKRALVSYENRYRFRPQYVLDLSVPLPQLWDSLSPLLPQARGQLVGFYLWTDGKVAWAQGTYEYRPMGTAVIASTDLFRRRDFDSRRKVLAPRDALFLGQFASLGHLNAQMRERRKKT